jgi:hypothetical protein
MENERFELKTVAHTVEMAVSSSKMLQIAWKMVRTGNPKKIPQTKKKKSPNNFLPFFLPHETTSWIPRFFPSPRLGEAEDPDGFQ